MWRLGQSWWCCLGRPGTGRWWSLRTSAVYTLRAKGGGQVGGGTCKCWLWLRSRKTDRQGCQLSQAQLCAWPLLLCLSAECLSA
jgi:hypothetical protein